MRGLVLTNVVWNTLFVLMMLSEMSGVSSFHQYLPEYGKWIWGVVGFGGNAVIHWLQLRLLAGEPIRPPEVWPT